MIYNGKLGLMAAAASLISLKPGKKAKSVDHFSFTRKEWAKRKRKKKTSAKSRKINQQKGR